MFQIHKHTNSHMVGIWQENTESNRKLKEKSHNMEHWIFLLTYAFFLNVLWFSYINNTSTVVLSTIHNSMYYMDINNNNKTSSFTKTYPKKL